MFNIIKNPPLYIKLFTDKVTVIRLDNGATISRTAKNKFSNPRLVVADFNAAQETIRAVINELIPAKFFQPSFHIVIQQMEKLDGGLSSVEERALRDSAEHCGGSVVKVLKGNLELTNAEALRILKEK